MRWGGGGMGWWLEEEEEEEDEVEVEGLAVCAMVDRACGGQWGLTWTEFGPGRADEQ